MFPRIVISYVDQKGGRVAKAAFVNESDALIFWNALPEHRRAYLVMHTLEGERITEIAHTGYNDTSWGGYYGHAYALTESQPLPPRAGSTRDQAARNGWEFVGVGADA